MRFLAVQVLLQLVSTGAVLQNSVRALYLPGLAGRDFVAPVTAHVTGLTMLCGN